MEKPKKADEQIDEEMDPTAAKNEESKSNESGSGSSLPENSSKSSSQDSILNDFGPLGFKYQKGDLDI